MTALQQQINAAARTQSTGGGSLAGRTLAIDMRGAAEVSAQLEVWRKLNAAAYEAAVFMWASNVMSTSLKLCPADTGYLRASRYVRRPEVTGSGGFTIEAGYGAPYALIVHEMNRHYVVGEWKFLARAIDHHRTTAVKEIASWTAKLAQAGMTIDSVPETHPRIWTGGARVVVKRTKKQRAARERDRAKNQERRVREMFDAFDGKVPRRPGRP